MDEIYSALQVATVGNRVRFKQERLAYTIRARSNRFLVCTRPHENHKTVWYTIIDLEEKVRGPENLVLGMGAESDQDCQEMINRLEGVPNDIRTEVSHRHRIDLDAIEVLGPNRNRKV